jgi:hypothetical protein
VAVLELGLHAVREQLLQQVAAFVLGQAQMRVLKCSLTNSAWRPVSGWVRTTGWATGRTCSICSGVRLGRQGLRACSSA